MSVNKAIILGRLGKDPEIRYTQGGDAVASFSVATSERYKDKSGEQQEKAEWHNMVVWGKLAEVIGEYLHKGDEAYFEGKIQTRKWQDKEGVDRYTTEVVVQHFSFVGNKRSDDNQSSPAPARQEPAKDKPAASQKNSFDNFDDDIPFQNTFNKMSGLWRAV